MTAPDVDQDPAAVAAQLDPDAQLDLLDRELGRRRAERAAEAKRAAAVGGPCSRCGAVESWQAPGVGGWAGSDQHGPICHACDQDRGGPAGDDREARIKACDLVLGDVGPPPWASVVPGVPTVAARWHPDYKADAMRWWYEVPGAAPGQGAERFAYMTAAELVVRLYQGREPAPRQLHSRGRRHRCVGCGARGEVWTVEQVGVSAPVDQRGEVRANRAGFRLTWRCHRCGHEDVEHQRDQLAGVPVAGLVG